MLSDYSGVPRSTMKGGIKMIGHEDDQILFARHRVTLYPFRDWAVNHGYEAKLSKLVHHIIENHKSYHYRLTITGFDAMKDQGVIDELSQIVQRAGFKWTLDSKAYAQEEVSHNEKDGKVAA